MEFSQIICANNVSTVVKKIQEKINQGCIIKGLCVVDQSENQAVILVSDEVIDDRLAAAWWAGFTKAIEG